MKLVDHIIGRTSKQMRTDLQTKLPEGWFLTTESEASHLRDELLREVPRGHLLYDKPVAVIASRRGESDDILCQHVKEAERYTVIHLSWSMRAEISPNYPTVEMDGAFNDFLEYEAQWQ